MKKTYKSDKSKLFICWLIASAIIGFVLVLAIGVLLIQLNVHRDVLFRTLLFIGCSSIAPAAYLAFYYWNIQIEVDAQAVTFIRGRKPYLCFRFSGNDFGSLVNVTIEGLGKHTARFLQVFPHGAQHGAGAQHPPQQQWR